MQIRIRCPGSFSGFIKAFWTYKVSHDDLMYKLKCLDICRKYYGLTHSFLSDSHQRVTFSDLSPLLRYFLDHITTKFYLTSHHHAINLVQCNSQSRQLI